jgi:hypothetical protein
MDGDVGRIGYCVDAISAPAAVRYILRIRLEEFTKFNPLTNTHERLADVGFTVYDVLNVEPPSNWTANIAQVYALEAALIPDPDATDGITSLPPSPLAVDPHST